MPRKFRLVPWLIVLLVISLSLNLLITLPTVIILSGSENLRFTFIEKAGRLLAQPRLIFLGDSLTLGGGNWSLRMGEPADFSVRTEGVSGGTILALQDSVDRSIAAKPEMIFLLGGTNDIVSRGFFGHSEEEVLQSGFESLTRYLLEIQEAGIEPVLTLVPHTQHPSHNEKIIAFNNRLRAFAAEHDIQVFDLNPDLAPDGLLQDQYALPDGVHLAPPAYEVWAAKARNLLKELK